MGCLEPCYLQGVEMAARCVVGCRATEVLVSLAEVQPVGNSQVCGRAVVEEEACSPRGPYSEVTYYRVGAMALG